MMRRVLSAFLALVMVLCLLPLTAFEAKAASAMKASDDIIIYLKTMEGFTAVPRWDYVQWTVGYGNRCPDEHLERYLREGIPIEEADALFLEQLAYFEDQVNAFIDRNGLTYSQHQFDAVLSITYNCGAAWLTGDSDLKKAVCDGTNGNKLIGIMSQWCTAGGEYLPGLMRRRLTEADMFLNGRYNTQIPENYAYVFFDAGEGKASAVAQGFDCNLYAVPLVTAERAGYTFLGWYTSATGGVKVTSLDENLHQQTLYAHWAEGEGTYDGGTDLVPEGVMVTVTGDVVNVRTGPGTNYPVVSSVVYGEKVLVNKVASDKTGRMWGRIERGWLCLDYTTYREVTGDTGDSGNHDPMDDSYVAPMYLTIVGGSISVYNGPDTGYPKVGTLKENTEVLIVKFYKMFTVWWGMMEQGGWICMNQNVLLHNDQMLAHSVNVTVTNSYLNVRSGPGTNYGWVASLNKGDTVKILAVEIVNGAIWGRFDKGWIFLEYTDFNASKLDQYRYHSYGAWYETEASTCVTHGTQKRDCRYCTHFETREAPLSGHTFGEWYEVSAGTCVEAGQQRRDCVYCDAYELQDTGLGDHSFGDWQEEIAAGCTEDGLQRRYCQYCDAYEEAVISAAGHSLGEWYETLAPTLTEYGEERRDCQHCDYYETRELLPVEHLFTDWYVTLEATCTENGEERRDCTDCEYFETRETDPKGHAFGEWITASEGSCTEGSVEYRECSVCMHREERTNEPVGHVLGDWYVSKQADCVNAGERCRDCENCDYRETQTISAKGHSMGQWVTDREPTCTEEGQKHRTCNRCDHTETMRISKEPHTFCDWYISIEPTYETPGQEKRDCEICGASETREKAFMGEVKTRVYATIICGVLNVRSGPGTAYGLVGSVQYGTVHEVFEQATVDGKVWGKIALGWICLTNNATLEEVTEVIAHTHTFGQWYDTKTPTCTEGGKQRRDCSGCTHYETRNVAAKGHSFTQWETITEATAEQNGLERRVCTVCGFYEERETEYKVETVKKIYGTLTGYDYLRIRAGIGVSYEVVGYLYRGDRVEILEIVDYGNVQWGRIAKGWVQLTGYVTLEEVEEPVEHTHSFGDWYTVTEVTCTQNGLQRRDCKYCDHSEEKTIAATGHSFGQWYTVTELSCTRNGVERRECANCGHSEEKTTPATGHSFGDWYTVTEATAAEKGLERRDCKNCDHYEERETQPVGGTVTKIFATITVASLNIRSGPGSGYGLVGYVVYGEVYEVYEQAPVGAKIWGRIDKGWICLTGYTKLEEVTESTGHTHSFGNWYTVTEATCTENGLQRRDCANCGHSEEKTIAATGHSFGQWNTVTEATCTENGLQRRDCANCGHSEEMTIAATGHSYGQWYTVTEATATEKGLERRDCTGCDHYEERETQQKTETVKKLYGTLTGNSYLRIRAGAGVNYAVVGQLSRGDRVEIFEIVPVGNTQWGRISQGWIQLTGYMTLEEVEEPVEHVHSFGDWYTVTEATAEAGGLERRDCTGCDHYEERETAPLGGGTVTKIFATITAGSLNIRSGPGSAYGLVGYVVYGEVYEVYEQTAVGAKIWGRIDKGWICLTGYTKLEEVTESAATGDATATMIVTAAILNVRAGAGKTFGIVTSLSYGTKVTVLEQKVVDGVLWARVEQGWVSMAYLK